MIITLRSGPRLQLEPDTSSTAGERFRVTSADDGFLYGHLERFYQPSHLRWRQNQTSPCWWRPIPAGGEPQTPVQTRYEALVLLHLYHVGRVGGAKWRMSHEG
jgi:hypothetical protein